MASKKASIDPMQDVTSAASTYITTETQKTIKPDKRDKRVNFLVNSEDLADFQDFCRLAGTSVNEQINRMIHDTVEVNRYLINQYREIRKAAKGVR